MTALLLALVLSAGADDKGARYEAVIRAQYVEAALDAVLRTRPAMLDQAYAFLAAMERGACAVDQDRLRSDCLIAAARRFCDTGGKSEGRRCPLFMDVISSNVLAERSLISASERYRMMQVSKDYRQQMMRALDRIYGSLAVDLRLASGSKPRAVDIDRHCLRTADVSSLPWQTCASALVWFIGRTR